MFGCGAAWRAGRPRARTTALVIEYADAATGGAAVDRAFVGRVGTHLDPVELEGVRSIGRWVEAHRQNGSAWRWRPARGRHRAWRRRGAFKTPCGVLSDRGTPRRGRCRAAWRATARSWRASVSIPTTCSRGGVRVCRSAEVRVSPAK